MHEHLQALLKAGWVFNLKGVGVLCEVTATKQVITAHDGTLGIGLSQHPIEALAQAMESAQIIEDTLKQ
jgi:hypothetical protein